MIYGPVRKPTSSSIMDNYVFGPGQSYQGYLQEKSLQRTLSRNISSAAKEIIVSDRALQEKNKAVLHSFSRSVSRGFEDVSKQIGGLAKDIRELNATFEWGFSELLTETSRINESLKELVRLAKTPSQTWAYEQFEIAREADSKGLYEEAIEYLDRAIKRSWQPNGLQVGVSVSLSARQDSSRQL